MAGRRDPRVERQLVDRAQYLARLTVTSLPAHVEARLAFGQASYGDSWTERTALELIAEAADESADLIGWSALAVQSLPELDADTAAGIREMIARACASAAEAYGYLTGVEHALRKVGQT